MLRINGIQRLGRLWTARIKKWLSFWNKFKAEICATDIPPVTNFAQLKKLLEKKNACKATDGFPFNSEAYERA